MVWPAQAATHCRLLLLIALPCCLNGLPIQGASIPVVDQLSHRQMLRFAHTAHERQLLTYLSAGIDASNLHKAVNVGIDGMGIGFALHAQAQGAVGALSRKKINAVLDARDSAQQTAVGQAARALAFLDYFSSFGALTEAENTARQDLYAALDQVRPNRNPCPSCVAVLALMPSSAVC